MSRTRLFGLIVSAGLLVGLSFSLPALVDAATTFRRSGFTCGQVGLRWLPGRMKQGRFVPLTTMLRDAKRALQRATSSTQRTQLASQISKLQQQIAAGRRACASGPGGSPTPTPNPDATATPRPTSTPTSQGCFDGSGNTPTTRSCFGIPAGTSGNVNRGAATWLSQGCQGCHAEIGKRNKTFSQINAAFSIPQMSAVPRPNTATLADITAYLNRFNSGN